MIMSKLKKFNNQAILDKNRLAKILGGNSNSSDRKSMYSSG